MSVDKRKHIRIHPKGIQAAIILTDDDGLETQMLGELLDMSYSGVRIKLSAPLPVQLTDSKIRIVLTMPETGLEVVIKGIIRHKLDKVQWGLEYSADSDEHEVDEFLFECVRKVDEP